MNVLLGKYDSEAFDGNLEVVETLVERVPNK